MASSVSSADKGSPGYWHITHVHCRYEIVSRGRRWLVAVNRTAGQRPYRDRIAINAESAGWQPGQTVELFARHEDFVTPYGHRVRLVPVPAADYWALPAGERF